MVYVALLRGVNVGGNSKVSMSDLKAMFEDLGYENVATYINSGNVIFSTPITNRELIVQNIEQALKSTFSMGIQVVVRDLDNVMAINRELPHDWTNDKNMRTDIMFLRDDIANPDTLEQIPSNPEIEIVRYVEGTIFWNISRENVPKSSVVKLINSGIYKRMTIRNVNTVRRVTQMMKDIKE